MRGADIVIVKPVSMAALLPLIRAYCFLGDFFGPRLLGASLNYAYLGVSSFLDGFKFFWNADSDRGFAPMAGELRIGADFFYFFGFGVVRG